VFRVIASSFRTSGATARVAGGEKSGGQKEHKGQQGKKLLDVYYQLT